MAKSPSRSNKPQNKISSSILPSAVNKAEPAAPESNTPRKATPEKPAPVKAGVKKKAVAAKPEPVTSAPEAARPVSPKAKVRIALASQSAAKAGKAMLTPTSAPETDVKPLTPTPPHADSAPSSGKKRILFITVRMHAAGADRRPGRHGLRPEQGAAQARATMCASSCRFTQRSTARSTASLSRARAASISARGEEIWVGIFEGKLDGEVPIWFIDYARYFDRPYIYDDQEDAYRFGVLSKAALQICKDTGWIPHVAHVHDWMTSMAAVFLKTWDRVLSPLSHTASVLTIHNIGYQGKFEPVRAAVLRTGRRLPDAGPVRGFRR